MKKPKKSPAGNKSAGKSKHPPKLPAFYYDSGRGFWIPKERGGWVLVNESALRRELKLCGFSPFENGEMISDLDRAISEIQKRQDVSYSGPLAGYRAGLYEILGLRVLVTESPAFIEPTPGECPLIRGILTAMLGEQQLPYLFGWLKLAIKALRSGNWQPGQALFLAGEIRSGKSLLQMLITKLLGREARPFAYMRGGTEFNAELFGAEHLVIEDEIGSSKHAARQWLAAKIKELTVNNAHRCHAKGRQALTLTPFWRVTVSLNCEQSSLSVLPVLDDSVSDKLIVLKVQRHAMPMPVESSEELKAFRDTLIAELPAFMDFLLKWEIPSEIRAPRFGIKHFHHPEIVAALNALPPHEQLLGLIDRTLFPTGEGKAWLGTAAEIESLLTAADNPSAADAKRLFSYPTACGFLLGAVAKANEGRVKCRRTATERRWQILPP